jgi:thioredoxin-related protein
MMLIVLSSNAQIDTSKVKWLSFEETKLLFDKSQKPVLIFVHDNKNDSSNLMLNQTFGLQEVANYVNALFYPIKLDIYSRDTITFFNGIVYGNNSKSGGAHSIVKSLLGEEFKFPSMILFTKKAEGSVFQGYRDRDRIFPLLIYFAESLNSATSYPNFEKNYYKTYPIGQKQIITRLNLKWKTLNEALELNKTSPKKLLINLYDNYSISSTMMRLETFNNSVNSNYLNQHFYCVNIDVKSNDTLEFLGQKFINEKASHGFHQFPIALLNGKMNFPAFVVFDEQLKYIDRVQSYMIPEDFELLIHFVGENAYKTQKIEEYKKGFKSNFSD